MIWCLLYKIKYCIILVIFEIKTYLLICDIILLFCYQRLRVWIPEDVPAPFSFPQPQPPQHLSPSPPPLLLFLPSLLLTPPPPPNCSPRSQPPRGHRPFPYPRSYYWVTPHHHNCWALRPLMDYLLMEGLSPPSRALMVCYKW